VSLLFFFNCVNQVDSIVQSLIKLLTNRLCNYAVRVRSTKNGGLVLESRECEPISRIHIN